MFIYVVFVMIRQPTRSTRTDTLYPYTTRCRYRAVHEILVLRAETEVAGSWTVAASGTRPVRGRCRDARHRGSKRGCPATAKMGRREVLRWRIRRSSTHTIISGNSDTAATPGSSIIRFRSEEHTSELQSLMRISDAV